MDGLGDLVIDLVNAYGERIRDTVDVSMRHTELQSMEARREVSNHEFMNPLAFRNLPTINGGTYFVTVNPRRYQMTGHAVQLKDGENPRLTIKLPIKREKITRVQFTDYDSLPEHLKNILRESRNVKQDCEDQNAASYDGQGAQLYNQIEQDSKAGLLNICAKMRNIKLEDGSDLFSYITSLFGVQEDRIYAWARKELKTIASQTNKLFHWEPDLAHNPPNTFGRVSSYKTYDAFGNLQLTFFKGEDDSQYLVDIDIDDAQYVGHIFQVADHGITHKRTNPYDIHEVLLIGQNIDPLYKLVV